MKIKKRYARRKKVSNYLFFGVAILMLTIFFFRSTGWMITAFIISIGLISFSAIINRCPNCRTRIKDETASSCPNCGCEIK